MVFEDIDHSLSQQDRRIQDQTSKGLLHIILAFRVFTPRQVPLEKYFPEYSGGADINKAAKYILWRFMQTNRARLSVYPQCVRICFVSS